MAGYTADVPQPDSGAALARRLHWAQARLVAQDLSPEVRARLQRHFIAVCDAAKAPGADPGACLRRLEGLLAALDRVVDKKSAYKN
jgi:hypothetical protein